MPGGSSVYRFGPFEFDPLRGRLFRGATRVPLADSQVAIPLQLVSCPGEVVSKDTRDIETVPNRGYRFGSVVERTKRYDPDASSDAPLAPYRAFVHGEDELDTF